MQDGLTIISVILGFGLVIAAGARFGAGSPNALMGLFVSQGGRDWPIGVQEPDAPRFAFGPTSAPTSRAAAIGERLTGDAPPAEIEELYAGPLRPLR